MAIYATLTDIGTQYLETLGDESEHKGKTEYSVWRIVETFYRADCVGGRATNVNLLEKVGHVGEDFTISQLSVQESESNGK